MFVLALIHTFPFIVFHVWKGDLVVQWSSGGIWVTGVVAIIAQAWLTFMSIPWIRCAWFPGLDLYFRFPVSTNTILLSATGTTSSSRQLTSSWPWFLLFSSSSTATSACPLGTTSSPRQSSTPYPGSTHSAKHTLSTVSATRHDWFWSLTTPSASRLIHAWNGGLVSTSSYASSPAACTRSRHTHSPSAPSHNGTAKIN